jgi:hypothetical protein
MQIFWKVIGALLLGIGSLFGLFKGFQLNQWRQGQEQTIATTPKLLQSIAEVKTNRNLAELQKKQAALQETVATLQAVPNLPGFDYAAAQTQIQQIRPALNTVTTRVDRLKQVDTALQDAYIADHEASELTKNPPQPVDRLTKAVELWKDAIQYLSDVPKNHASYAQAQAGLPNLKQKLTQTEKLLVQEKIGVRKFDSAVKATEATIKSLSLGNLVTGTTLKTAQAKLRQSITFLKEVPSEATVFKLAERFLPIAEMNLNRVNNSLSALQCGTNLTSPTCVAELPPQIDELAITRPPAIASGNAILPSSAGSSHVGRSERFRRSSGFGSFRSTSSS